MKLIKLFILAISLTAATFPKAGLVDFGGILVQRDLQMGLLRSFETEPQPKSGYKTPVRVPVLRLRPLHFDSPARENILRRAEDLEPTPLGADGKIHRRTQIDGANSEEEAAAARYRRYCRERNTNPTDAPDENFESWVPKYERIRNNGAGGRGAEEHALREFNVPSNNIGTTVLFEDENCDEQAPSRRRPDGLAQDENGQEVVVEVKHKRPGATVYATQQIRTEERAAIEADGRHVVILSLTEEGEFPRVSRSYQTMITEFRLIVGENVYRLNKETGVWEKVE